MLQSVLMPRMAPKAWHAPVTLLLCFVVIVCFAQYIRQTSDDPFDEFVKRYNKRYSVAEYYRRREVFWQNIAFIRAHDPSSFEVKVNQFADLTRFEFERTHLGLEHKSSPFRNTPLLGAHEVAITEEELPESVDWVAAGKVSPVANQGMCGSCYTFSAVNAIESAIAIQDSTEPVQLSNQQILDCSHQRGCIGGTMDDSFDYASKAGLCEYHHYPYRGFSGACQTGCKKVIPPGYVMGYMATKQDDVSLMSAVTKQPVSVGIDADGLFQFYSGGVFTQPCGSALNHGVLVVGYGIRKKQKYWLVKNSWGDHWGIDGYVLIERGNTEAGPGGKCGILKFGSYPVLDPAKAPARDRPVVGRRSMREKPDVNSMQPPTAETTADITYEGTGALLPTMRTPNGVYEEDEAANSHAVSEQVFFVNSSEPQSIPTESNHKPEEPRFVLVTDVLEEEEEEEQQQQHEARERKAGGLNKSSGNIAHMEERGIVV